MKEKIFYGLSFNVSTTVSKCMFFENYTTVSKIRDAETMTQIFSFLMCLTFAFTQVSMMTKIRM